MSRAYVHVNFSGTIAVADLAKLAGMITIEEQSVGVAPADVSVPTVAAPTPAVEASAPAAEVSPPATTEPGDGTVDAHGHPWSAELHAATKSMTKDGLWRMKVGVTRPDPLPGFPVGGDAATGTSSNASVSSTTNSATSTTATAQASVQPDTSTDDDDEFAAFRDAVAKSESESAAAVAAVPARTWTDADLGALCNQAAVKLGDPSPIKEVIAAFVPEGTVAHSRNVPEARRAEFAAAIEAKAGITFAG